MKLKLGIRAAFLRKALGISLVVLMSIGFSYSGALANGCRGGVDCLACAPHIHPQVSILQGQMENQSCWPAADDVSCAVENGRRRNEYDGGAAFIGTYHQASFGFTAAARLETGSSRFSKAFLPSFLSYDPGGLSAIYLLNQSLLC